MKMGRFGDFICLFLVAFGAHTCMAGSKTMKQVHKVMANMDEIIEAADIDARKYVVELHDLSENLKANATSNAARLSKAQNHFIATLKRNLDELVATADGLDVSECTDLVKPVVSTAIGLLENGAHCIREELDQADKEINLVLPYIDLQLNTLARFQSSAQYCATRFHQSNQAASDAAAASSCVKLLHESTKLVAARFKSIIDLSLSRYLFHVAEIRITECAETSMTNLYWFYSPADSVGGDILACVTEAIESNVSK